MYFEKLHVLYSPTFTIHMIKSGRMRQAGHVEHVRDETGIHSILVEKSEGQRSPARPMHGWENNPKMDLKEIRSQGTVRIHLTLNRERWWNLVNMKITLQEP
jgi:hypothetical protein